MANLTTLGLLGCGNMGGAVARGAVASGLLSADRVFIFDSEPKAMQPLQALGCKAVASTEELFEKADVIVLAIKPQVFRATPPTPQRGEKTVVSVMAGIRVAQMRAAFPNSFTVIRVMPNLGLSVGEGATAIASDGLTEASLQLAESIFQSCGKTVRVTEDLIDAVTGVSGSGPMYVFEFVEALTQGGVDAGLTRETAYELALQTVKGSAKILENSTDAPQTWSARVRSPGGTTAEAQKVLEAGNFHDLVNRAVQAAVRRSKELSG